MSQRGLVAGALTSVAGWLVEPEQAAPAPAAEPVREVESWRPVVAVVGVRRGCGVTTIARGLGAALATRDPVGSCVVTASRVPGPAPLGLPAGTRLARWLAPHVGGRLGPCGRLCLSEGADRVTLANVAREFAPVVFDVSDPADAAAAASLADRVLLVVGPGCEPALAAVIAESLAVVGPTPRLVVNRCNGTDERWAAHEHVAVADSRLAAQLAAAGREPRGAVGDAVAELAERVG